LLLTLSLLKTLNHYSSERELRNQMKVEVCHACLLLECPQHQGHKGIRVTPKTLVILGEGIQVDLVLGIGPRPLRMPPIHED
jgi:hypothetical protein